MTIVGRFLLMLILSVIFRDGNCEVHEWNLSFNETVLRAICSLECSDEPCIKNCTGTKRIEELNEEAMADVRLVCRDQDYMVLAHNPGLFVTETFRTSQLSLSHDTVISDGTQVVMYGLWGETSFQFRLHRLSANGISMPEMTEEIETLPHAFWPMDVTNITIGKIEVESWPLIATWIVEISFTPSADRPCFYEISCQQDDGEYHRIIYLSNEQQYSVTFRSLPYAANFTVTIKSLTDDLRWGNSYDVRGTIATFSTPRCQNPKIGATCLPKAVKGLNATAIHKTDNIFDVLVTWDVPADYDDFPSDCSIDLHPIGTETEDPVSEVVPLYEVNVVFQNVIILDQYDVYIRGTNWVGEGPLTSRRFTTGLKEIVPTAVKGLNATVTPKVENTFDIHVTWDWPEIIPDIYIVSIILNGSETNHSVFHNISGSANETVFPSVEISGDFNVSMKAWSSAGGGPEITQRFTKPQTSNGRTDVPEDIRIPIYLMGSIMIMVTGISITAYGKYRSRKRRLNKNSPVDGFEMNPERLTITRVLGTGAFGVVKLGSLHDDQGNVTNVAVKMLHDDSNENDRRNFLHEIKIMKAMDEHPNIVCLLGCNTTGPYPFLIVEYCSRGDLQSFLRKSLEEASTLAESKSVELIIPSFRSPRRKEILQANSRSLPVFRNRDNYVQAGSCCDEQDINRESGVVTVMDMLNFGRQIATGMEFLSSSRIVHRDLACRNILVRCDRIVKISDFGLSRDIYRENIYKKSGNGRMPLKWMAIEALTHQAYTTYSDVWSFGIVLWEIMTRGGDPYPGVPTIEILNWLHSGYRMERPANCSFPLYNVMLSCWQTRPKDRPTFTILRQELDKLICAATESKYFDLNDVLEETPPEDKDVQTFSFHPISHPVQMAIVNDTEPPIITMIQEGTMDEPDMS